MIHTFEQRHAPGHRLCPCFGGSSSSAASTSSTTENTDMRVIGGNDSTNTSTKIDATNSTITLTDAGAIQAGAVLASQAIEASTASSAAALDAGGNMFNGALTAVSKANEQLTQAYQQGQAGDQTSLKYAGFIVVGLAAVMIFKK
jgi:hypothetical protein